MWDTAGARSPAKMVFSAKLRVFVSGRGAVAAVRSHA